MLIEDDDELDDWELVLTLLLDDDCDDVDTLLLELD